MLICGSDQYRWNSNYQKAGIIHSHSSPITFSPLTVLESTEYKHGIVQKSYSNTIILILAEMKL